MQRRRFLVGSAAALALPAIARAQASRVLRFVPDADLASLDPVWTTSYQTRDHGFMVYDTLFGSDSQFRPQPQMLDGAAVESDGLTWKLSLRTGLKFHDGERVLARDCVASIVRWGKRDTFGQALLAATDELFHADDRTIVFRLKYPFPLLPEALSKTAPSMCPIMPLRLAETDPFKQVTEAVGSGPYRYKADERVPGARVVWERNPDYVPREDAPSRTAGAKIANFDRIEWAIMPDTSTVASAIQRGEVDWWYTPPADLLALLKKAPGVKLQVIVPTGTIATMRFNHLQPPFDNPAIRRAMLGAIKQADYMTAVNGENADMWRDHVGYFCPNTPMASDAGIEALTGPRDLDQVKRNLAAAGYKGEKVVLLGPMDIPSTKALAEVTADLLKRLGMNLDFQAMDWATVVQRRVKTDPVDQGGWSIFQTSWSGLDQFNPAGHVFLRGNGRNAAPGWPTSPKIEELRDAWLRAPDLAAQQKIAEQLQLQAFQDVPYIPLGQTITPTAYRADLTGLLDGLPLFWNVRRS
ncbi:ABC transporter substrate-binding protein [Limobrevibacterium gyesilva]|uniref:ABC transporter substrate-binding protein n=1 Tax=Limobrevibacterium gyesilva TaxID=2991712 RepID=A0AA41YJX7_9PROT|nr:ABC transporter substrate-binding protein [Limobrevibacterium gyesilva]MCW3473497.1 ABC transporter substrate-binding protein [Limobrevibacterium gyesilva]